MLQKQKTKVIYIEKKKKKEKKAFQKRQLSVSYNCCVYAHK